MKNSKSFPAFLWTKKAKTGNHVLLQLYVLVKVEGKRRNTSLKK